MNSVIDTNVLIVANGKSEHASIECQLNCLEYLENHKNINVCVDNLDLIMDEYQRHCSHAGSPGVGDMFFKYLHDNQYDPTSAIELVAITPIEDVSRSFEELPANDFDPSDRKFLATACSADAEVINATDSDWHEQAKLMSQFKVTVLQLCPDCCTRT
jgi:predicted nucleic acid-binding protein